MIMFLLFIIAIAFLAGPRAACWLIIVCALLYWIS